METVPCPVCNQLFSVVRINEHVNQCLDQDSNTNNTINNKLTNNFVPNNNNAHFQYDLASNTLAPSAPPLSDDANFQPDQRTMNNNNNNNNQVYGNLDYRYPSYNPQNYDFNNHNAAPQQPTQQFRHQNAIASAPPSYKPYYSDIGHTIESKTQIPFNPTRQYGSVNGIVRNNDSSKRNFDRIDRDNDSDNDSDDDFHSNSNRFDSESSDDEIDQFSVVPNKGKGKGKGKAVVQMPRFIQVNEDNQTHLRLEPSQPQQHSWSSEVPYPYSYEDEEERRRQILEDERMARQMLEEEERVNHTNTVPMVCCMLCQQSLPVSEFTFLNDCHHTFCPFCLHEHAMNEIKAGKNTIKCPMYTECATNLSNSDMRTILTSIEYDNYIENSFRTLVKSNRQFVSCPKCPNIIEHIPVQNVDHLRTRFREMPTHLSEEAFLHKEQNRLRCPQCSTNFCAQCSTMPYHEGYTCGAWTDLMNSKRCRFCDGKLTKEELIANRSSPPAFSEVCSSEECTKKMEMSCSKVLPCTHFCCGIAGETTCLPCLRDECIRASGDTTLTQNDEDFCNICYTESLKAAPCIRIECGHIFHFSCVKSKLEKGSAGARITFGFMNCPLCKKPINHPSLASVLDPLLKLKADIEKKAMARLNLEGHDKDDSIVKEGGKFYQNPLGYAMSNFAYYPCAKCKKPYFGGMRRCEENGDGNDHFDPSELVCGACTSLNSQTCATHGAEYIEHKCKFCCSVATWFCWGTTHFCDECHKKQVAGDHVTRIPVEQLPKCPGPAKCPLGCVHPANGTEFSLGCAICRRQQEF